MPQAFGTTLACITTLRILLFSRIGRSHICRIKSAYQYIYVICTFWLGFVMQIHKSKGEFDLHKLKTLEDYGTAKWVIIK